MKILHVYDGHERVAIGEGSVPYVVYSLAKCSAKLGHEVTVIERRWDGTQSSEVIDGVKFVRIKLGFGSNISGTEPVYSQIKTIKGIMQIILEKLSFSLKVLLAVSSSSYDIIHFHLPFSSNILIRMSKRIKKKSVYTAHVGQENIRFSLNKSIPLLFRVFSPDLALVKMARRTVLLNEDLEKKLTSKGISKELLEVIPNGTDKPVHITTQSRKKELILRYNLNGKVVLFAGTVFPRKGIDILLKAITVLKRGDFTLVIIGRLDADVEYVKSLMKYTAENHLNVVYTGLVNYDELVSLYELADVGVLPSLEEGDPIFLKEMLALGKPLLGSRIPGIIQQILDGKNGFTFEVGDYLDLSKKLEILLDNIDLRNEFSKESMILSSNFTWERVTKKYIELYRSIVPD